MGECCGGLFAFFLLVFAVYWFSVGRYSKEISVDELCTNYRNYAGKTVRVRDILKNVDTRIMTLVERQGIVYCVFDKYERFSTSGVAPGDDVSIVGRCSGVNQSFHGTFSVDLRDARGGKVYRNG